MPQNIGPDGLEFRWGRIDAIHTIGEFEIVESTRTRPIANSQAPDRGVGEVSYHAYVSGRNASHSRSTLDSALAFCLAYKYDDAGPNTRADRYFLRMIGFPS